MLIELIFAPFVLLINFIISLIPEGFNIPQWGFEFLNLVNTGLSFFPSSVFLIIIGNVGFWLTAHMVWAIIEWVYKKIPGVS